MFTQEQIAFVKARVQAVTGVSLPAETAVSSGPDGLRVQLKGGSAEIRADGINSLARGFFLLARAVRENVREGAWSQRRHFSSCGTMLDMSRNAVMKPQAVMDHIDRLAALGMNLLMLYTEDTFTVPEYPAFGYLRGAYTQQELRQIDQYAASLGVEVVPCIQTLAHLAQFLQWDGTEDLADTQDILLIGQEAVYDFIEAEIRSVSSCVRSRRIHIGMDEAHGVGLGRYYAEHGPADRFELLSRHLERVVAICRRYGLKPMMWSDMFFTLGSKTGSYYDPEAVIPQSVVDSMPDVALCYWDYYHTDPEIYDMMLTRHQQMCGETVFAGGIWTWSGFLPQVKRTEATMGAGLPVCARHRVDTVLATLWGDDGAETSLTLGTSLLPVFSEACWQGPGVSRQEVVLAGECVSGVPRSVVEAWGEFYPDEKDSCPGKQLIWCDPMYPLVRLPEGDSFDRIIERSRRALDAMKGQETPECRYASLLFDVCIRKAEWMQDLRPRYLAGDRAWLQETLDTRLPALIDRYAALKEAHRNLWERDCRRFGWEVLSLRYGGVISRMLDARDAISRYLSGGLERIEELEVQPLPLYKHRHQLYGRFVTPARDTWQML